MALKYALTLLVLVCAGILRAEPAHDVYVWQRLWTSAVREALVASRADFAGVRVLVAQVGRDGRRTATGADPAAFTADSRARVAVVRYTGSGAPPDVSELVSYLADLLRRWRENGAAFAGVEIDYDCSTAKLADYAEHLHRLRALLPSGVRLSVTALPAWLDAPSLDAVLSAADEAVLQVHAVQDPQRGLFDAAVAERWIRTFAPHASRGFRVALPAYGSRVRFEGGRAVAVESEMPVDAAAAGDARELHAEPADVAALLERLRAAPPPNWKGVVWFRLPLAGDRRAWTLAALREVIDGRVPRTDLSAEIDTQGGGASDIFIVNRGSADAAPAGVEVSGHDCSDADAASGWSVAGAGDVRRFAPTEGLRVRAGTRRAVGWVRCAADATARVE